MPNPAYKPTTEDQILETKLHLAQLAILYEADKTKRPVLRRNLSKIRSMIKKQRYES